MRRWSSLAVVVCLVGVVVAGCGKSDGSTPVACLEGPNAYVAALDGAPGEVKVADETAISDCLTENQDGGDLSTIGIALVEAATKLSAQARAQPGGEANLELGYLVGAVAKGAESTEGIHSELVRRLAVAARTSPDGEPLTKEFVATYQRGYDAGHENG
jgi:hypothetical protein